MAQLVPEPTRKLHFLYVILTADLSVFKNCLVELQIWTSDHSMIYELSLPQHHYEQHSFKSEYLHYKL